MVTGSAIVPRMLAKERPVAYRVLLTSDPVTTGKIMAATHVGQTVYLGALPVPRKPLNFPLKPVCYACKHTRS